MQEGKEKAEEKLNPASTPGRMLTGRAPCTLIHTFIQMYMALSTGRPRVPIPVPSAAPSPRHSVPLLYRSCTCWERKESRELPAPLPFPRAENEMGCFEGGEMGRWGGSVPPPRAAVRGI